MHFLIGLAIASFVLWAWWRGAAVAAIFIWLLLSIGGGFVLLVMFDHPGGPDTVVRIIALLVWFAASGWIARLPISISRRRLAGGRP